LSSVLVVDDERALVGMVASLLGEDGYEVVTAYDGETALRRHAEESPDLVILDRKLPRLTGDEVCRRIRAISSTPILMLTGEKGSDERARLLDLGADDYLEKPFSRKELSARVRALLRRAAPAARARPAASIGKLTVDARAHQATVAGESMDLTPTEFRLLYTLAREQGRVLTRDELLQRVWGRRATHRDRTVDVFVRKLREKVDRRAPKHTFIHTRYGVGYKLEAEPK